MTDVIKYVLLTIRECIHITWLYMSLVRVKAEMIFAHTWGRMKYGNEEWNKMIEESRKKVNNNE